MNCPLYTLIPLYTIIRHLRVLEIVNRIRTIYFSIIHWKQVPEKKRSLLWREVEQYPSASLTSCRSKGNEGEVVQLCWITTSWQHPYRNAKVVTRWWQPCQGPTRLSQGCHNPQHLVMALWQGCHNLVSKMTRLSQGCYELCTQFKSHLAAALFEKKS